MGCRFFASRRVPWVVALVVLGCGGGGGSPPPPATPSPPLVAPSEPAAADRLSGQWRMKQVGNGIVGHDDVVLKLEAEGSHVLGTYAADKGKIDGEVKGNVVTGSWEEENGNGTFRWELSPDGKTFQGTFAGMLHSKPVPEGATWSAKKE
jgi:hypothetical protein